MTIIQLNDESIKYFKKSNAAVTFWEVDPVIAYKFKEEVLVEYDILIKAGQAVAEVKIKEPSSLGFSRLLSIFITILLLAPVFFLALTNAPITAIGDYLDMVAWTLYLGVLGIILISALLF